MTTSRELAKQERRRSNAAGVHVTRQTRAAMLKQAFELDPLEWARMRQQITAVEEADREDED
jgi:hypothetical protein